MRTIISTMILFVCLSAGCGSPTQKNRAQEFRANMGSNLTTLDPAKARDLDTFSVLRMLFDGLTRIGVNEKPELALASELHISEDQKTYTFTLKKSRWSNGYPLTANDFVYAWRRALDPNFPSDYASQLFLIKNGKEIKKGELAKEELGVHAIDKLTLQVELEKPTPFFLELLSFPVFFPLPESWVESHPHFDLHVKEYVSNGPFSLSKWKYDDELVLTKNRRYWDKSAVHLNKVTLVMVEREAELLMFERKELDWAGSPMSSLPVDALNRLTSDGKRVVMKPFSGMVFIRINTQKPYLDNPDFRKALGYAVNRKEIVDHVMRSGQVPSTNFVPQSLRGKGPACFEDNATERARHCLSQVDVTVKPQITLLFCNGKRNHLKAQTLQEQWRRALGIVVKLEASERGVYFSRLSKGDFDMAMGDWVADFNDPINFLEVLKTKDHGTNKTGWGNRQYTEMLEQSFSIADKGARLQLLADAEKIMLDEMPIIPLDQAAMVYVYHDWVKDVFISSMGNMELKRARIVSQLPAPKGTGLKEPHVDQPKSHEGLR